MKDFGLESIAHCFQTSHLFFIKPKQNHMYLHDVCKYCNVVSLGCAGTYISSRVCEVGLWTELDRCRSAQWTNLVACLPNCPSRHGRPGEQQLYSLFCVFKHINNNQQQTQSKNTPTNQHNTNPQLTTTSNNSATTPTTTPTTKTKPPQPWRNVAQIGLHTAD